MGLFQKDVAKIIGVSTDTIMNWEKGRNKPCRKNSAKVMDPIKLMESKENAPS